MTLRLDIGSGPHPRDGFTGVDLYAEGFGIVNAPMDHLPYPDNSIEEIYSSHALEHIGKREIVATLREWYRVLQPGGKLFIEVPNLAWVVTNWTRKQTDQWALDAIFGNQDDSGQFHKTGYTPEIMYRHLAMAGFTGQVTTAHRWSHEQDCLCFELLK